MQDMADNRLAQYGNLQCNASLDDLVPPHEEAYADANEETRSNLTSAENKARFFDTTFQLILPTTHDEEVDDRDYIGRTLDWLRGEGMVYEGRLEPPKGVVPEDWEDREQTLFRASEHGDDTDHQLLAG